MGTTHHASRRGAAIGSRTRAGRIVALVALASIAVTGTILGTPKDAAVAADYPSWNDVQAARASEAAKKAEVASIRALLTNLEAQVASTQAVAEQKGAEYQKAQLDYDQASFKAGRLQGQADKARTTADKSKQQAGQLAARLSRASNGDLSTRLFFSGNGASDLLAQLGLASMVKDQSAGLYEKAMQDQNTAQALTDQANVAKQALQVLADAAEKALAAAAAAADAAASALAEQQDNKARLEAQLATLETNTDHVEAEYQAGLVALWGAGAAGAVSPSGWARPAGGHISSSYGYRLDPYYHRYQLHSGTDLGAGCNTPIYAAHSGVVVYAGPYGGYGNYIKIANNDGSGLSTAYGHIVNGGIGVRIGQSVGPGQNIARVGSTGASTGCHLHFEVYRGGTTIDPVPFMRTQGIELAN